MAEAGEVVGIKSKPGLLAGGHGALKQREGAGLLLFVEGAVRHVGSAAMDVAAIKVRVAGVHEAGLHGKEESALDGFQLTRVGPVDLSRDALEERVGGLVAFLEFIADLLDVLREALLEGDDFRQGLSSGAQIAAEQLEHLLHLWDGLAEFVLFSEEGVGVALGLADLLDGLCGELA